MRPIVICIILLSLAACNKDQINHAPELTLNTDVAFHSQLYNGQLTITDEDEDQLTVGINTDATWLRLNKETLQLSVCHLIGK